MSKSIGHIFVFIALAASIVVYFDFQTESTLVINPIQQCLNVREKGGTLCAFCHHKTENELKSKKAFKVMSKDEFALISLQKYWPQLTCRQYLQLVDYESMQPSMSRILFDQNAVLVELKRQIGALISYKGKDIQNVQIPIQINEFVLLTFIKENQQTKINFYFPNLETFKPIFLVLMYLSGLIFVLALLLRVLRPVWIQKLQILKYLLILATILSAGLYSYYKYTDVYLGDEYFVPAKLLFLVLCLIRIQVSAKVLWIFVLFGVLSQFSSFLWIGFILLVGAVVGMISYDKAHLQPILKFQMLILAVFLVNELVLYNFVYGSVDFGSRIVSLVCVVYSPLALMMRNQKMHSFKEYVPSDPQRHSISLSGYQETEQQQQED